MNGLSRIPSTTSGGNMLSLKCREGGTVFCGTRSIPQRRPSSLSQGTLSTRPQIIPHQQLPPHPPPPPLSHPPEGLVIFDKNRTLSVPKNDLGRGSRHEFWVRFCSLGTMFTTISLFGVCERFCGKRTALFSLQLLAKTQF